MKYIFFTTVLFCTVFAVNAQSYQTLKDSDSSKMLTGFINSEILRTDSSFNWFIKAYTNYRPKAPVVKIFADNKDSIHFLVFSGTWCEDSRFVIPRFYKILDSAGFNKKNVTLLAVDRSKKDKTNLSNVLNVTHVPTIIVFRNGKELGRVVEYGETGKYDEEVAALITAPL